MAFLYIRADPLHYKAYNTGTITDVHAGGGMFVGCVVAGCVTLAAKGVRVRGALLRDVAAYAASAGLVALMIGSKSMTYAKAALLLVFYVVFIIIVFIADIAHILASRMR